MRRLGPSILEDDISRTGILRDEIMNALVKSPSSFGNA